MNLKDFKSGFGGLPEFAQVHFVLHAGHAHSVAIGIELVVQLKNHAVRISVCATACRCQEPFRPLFLFSTATIFRLATVLFSLGRFAAYSRVSPGPSANSGSAEAFSFFAGNSLTGGAAGAVLPGAVEAVGGVAGGHLAS